MKLKSQLMSTDEITRALKRIAHQITERNNGIKDVILLGITNGGIPIVRRLADYLKSIENVEIMYGVLDISNHRDDKDKPKKHTSEASSIPCDINGKNVVLVDDVLYTGRTARAAFDALSDFGRAGTVQLAVLIDRGHRELPIRADYVGKNIPTSRSETVRVDFNEAENEPVVNIYDL